MASLKNSIERDKMIINQLYHGNHLNDEELERANKLVYLMDIELKSRIKTSKR